MGKRGYHRHFRTQGNAALSRPVLDADIGYVITPMEQGIRMTTGVEFAARHRAPTPRQLDQALPKAHELFPLGAPADDKTWLGCRPCFPDSRPVIGRAPGLPGFWLSPRPRPLGRTPPPPPTPPPAGHRPPAGGDDGGRDAVLRSGALSRRTLPLAAELGLPAQ